MKWDTVIQLILILASALMLFPAGQALQTFSGETVSIDREVGDDVLAAGSMVSVNAPVDSVIAMGGTVNINAPVKGDVIAAAGQVFVNADVGGKVVAAGGNVQLGGDIGTNLLAAGGTVNVLPGKTVGRDALLAGDNVVNAGHVNGTLTVSATRFNNTGLAGRVDYHRIEEQSGKKEAEMYKTGFSILGLLSLIGYFILGLILVRYLPGAFRIVDEQLRDSALFKTLLGFVMIIASFIALLLVAMTVVGLPIALISSLLIFAALLLSGTFVSYSLGRWIGQRTGKLKSDLAYFALGFVILNLLYLLPLVGGLASLIATSLGFAGLLYAARELTSSRQAKNA
ncbi:MAG TPA: hypothetical protein PKK11_00710 [Methanothrix sp.]|nr:hypothetical protein [Methanothrix sp.]HPT18999.1 hypothetical protein [Methanothrix sp.]